MREPAGEALRAEGIRGDPRRSLVKRQILCVDEPVGVGTADGGLGQVSLMKSPRSPGQAHGPPSRMGFSVRPHLAHDPASGVGTLGRVLLPAGRVKYLA